jgi:L-iditol 2-dehydrogenase
MRAAVFHGIGDLRLEEREIPKPKEGEVVVKVDTSGLCPTDVRIYKFGSSLVKPPIVLGHEFSGSVYSIGALVDIQEGVKVNVAADAYCGVCPMCQSGYENLCSQPLSFGYNVDGAHADYVLIPKRFVKKGLLFKVPNHIPMEEAAMTEPFACVMHSIKVSGTIFEKNVAIIGDGPMGILHALAAKLYGANEIILVGLTDWKLKLGEFFGASRIINAKEHNVVESIGEYCKNGVDVTILTVVNSETFTEALKITRKRGYIIIFAGIPKGSTFSFDPNEIHYNEISIMGSSGYTYKEYEEAFNLIANKNLQLSRLISHQFELSQIREAISKWEDKENSLKIILKR